MIGNEIGRKLDERSRMLAQQAEINALERGASGRPVAWSNPDNGRRGEIVPGAAYRRSGSDCRDYVHTVTIDGRQETLRGSACRNSDGTWRQMS